MVEQSAVARVNQHPGGAVNKIGIAVVGGHGLPNKGMKILEYVHNFCFSPINRGIDLARNGPGLFELRLAYFFLMSITLKKADVKHKEHQFVHPITIFIDVRKI